MATAQTQSWALARLRLLLGHEEPIYPPFHISTHTLPTTTTSIHPKAFDSVCVVVVVVVVGSAEARPLTHKSRGHATAAQRVPPARTGDDSVPKLIQPHQMAAAAAALGARQSAVTCLRQYQC